MQPASGPSSDISPQSLIVSHNHDGGTQIEVLTQRNGAAAGQSLCLVVIATVDDDNELPAATVNTQHLTSRCLLNNYSASADFRAPYKCCITIIIFLNPR